MEKRRVTNAAAGGKKADKRKRRWGIEKGEGEVKKRGENWNNVTSSSKKLLKFYFLQRLMFSATCDFNKSINLIIFGQLPPYVPCIFIITSTHFHDCKCL